MSRSADASETRDILLSSVPEGLDAVVLAELVSSTAQAGGAAPTTLVQYWRGLKFNPASISCYSMADP